MSTLLAAGLPRHVGKRAGRFGRVADFIRSAPLVSRLAFNRRYEVLPDNGSGKRAESSIATADIIGVKMERQKTGMEIHGLDVLVGFNTREMAYRITFAQWILPSFIPTKIEAVARGGEGTFAIKRREVPMDLRKFAVKTAEMFDENGWMNAPTSPIDGSFYRAFLVPRS